MKSINKITSFIDKVCVFAGVCLLIFIAGSIAAQVVVRKLGGSMFWVDEMTRYAFIWLVLFGTVDLARKGGHITITTFLDMLPQKMEKIANCVIYVAVAAFAGLMAYTYFRAISNYEGVTFSVVTAIPMGFHNVLIGILMSLITLASFLHIVDIAYSMKGETET